MEQIINLSSQYTTQNILFALVGFCFLWQLLKYLPLTKQLIEVVEHIVRYTVQFVLEKGYDLVIKLFHMVYEIVSALIAEIWKYRIGKAVILVSGIVVSVVLIF